MTAREEIDRWDHTLKQVIIPFDQMWRASKGRLERFRNEHDSGVAIEAFARPLLETWESSAPPEGSPLNEILKPAISAAHDLDPSLLEMRPIKHYIDLAKKAMEMLHDYSLGGETAAEVVNEMEHDLKILVMAARLGHRGIMDLINSRWGKRFAIARTGKPDRNMPKYIDSLSFTLCGESGDATVGFPDLLASVHPGVGTIQEVLSDSIKESETDIQARFAGMWFVTFYTEWELNYRIRLAAIHGCGERAIRSTLMQDLNYMRNDFAHNRGIASERQKRCKRLKWFSTGDRMQPMQRHYMQLLEEFATERSVFMTPPKLYKNNRVEVKGHVPQDLVDRYNEIMKARGNGVDEVLEAALSMWVEANG